MARGSYPAWVVQAEKQPDRGEPAKPRVGVGYDVCEDRDTAGPGIPGALDDERRLQVASA